MASYNASAKAYLTLEERLAPGAPINAVPIRPKAIVDWALETLDVDVYNFGGFTGAGTSDGVLSPFTIRYRRSTLPRCAPRPRQQPPRGPLA
jgi:hypothetical protein